MTPPQIVMRPVSELKPYAQNARTRALLFLLAIQPGVEKEEIIIIQRQRGRRIALRNAAEPQSGEHPVRGLMQPKIETDGIDQEIRQSAIKDANGNIGGVRYFGLQKASELCAIMYKWCRGTMAMALKAGRPSGRADSDALGYGLCRVLSSPGSAIDRQ